MPFVDALANEDISWDDVRKTLDFVIEEDSHPFGHSLEAVGEL